MAEQITELVNKDVRFPRVLVIDEEGNQLGSMTSKEAQFEANKRDLDLVCVAPKAAVPVCKLMDYGKYKYEKTKREKEAKKKQNNAEVREIQLTYTIAQHDMETKARSCKKLIEQGDYVRIVLRLRGRETSFEASAKQKVLDFVSLCSEFSQIRKNIFVEGRDIKVILERKKVK